ncbi:MAG: siphovirus ReqiPepy6 Gp37-like family protein [Oscillospiraceae bacterium]|jgi:hypothetical protein|nr:siphovirus ReqiPepy6 Gp37-like family protein [Oscillospiraceae bacterium]
MELRLYQGNPPQCFAVTEDVDYLAVTHGFRNPGELTLKGTAREGRPVFAIGQTVVLAGGGEAFVIESVEINDAREGGSYTVRGRTHAGLLDSRVIEQSGYYTGCVALIARQMISDIISQPNRALPGVVLDIDTSLGYVAMFQPETGSLLNAVTSALSLDGLGLRSVFDPTAGVALLQVYEGADRSQSPPFAIFDADYDMLAKTDSRAAVRGTANAAYVLGENGGDGVPKKEVVERGGADTPARREVLLKFSQTSRTDYGTALTDTQYRGAMRAYAAAELAAMSANVLISGEVSAVSAPYIPGADYNLGDIVLVRAARNKPPARMRIDAIAETWARGEPYRTRLTFVPV